MDQSPNLTVRPSVLVIVDDDAAVRDSLRFSLQIEGFAVRTYPGAAALFDGPLTDCDCLVVDQIMAEMTGLELIAVLRTRGITAPAILITSHPSVAVREQAARAGIPIVEKPLLNSTLGDCIRQSLAQRPA